MRSLSLHRRKRPAFTLVELIIVGTLIAIFSGLAIFGVQQQFRSNQRKAIIGETRQVASALDFAYNDLGFFPKLCFLDDSLTGLQLAGQRAFGGNGTQTYYFMHIGNIPTGPKAGIIAKEWLGPYFAASQSRSQVSQGRGGSKPMLLPDYRAGDSTQGIPGAVNDAAATFAWPVDVFNNPYMVYSLNVDRTNANAPVLRFINEEPIAPNRPETDPGQTGDFINAVVSYGPNRVPGGGELFRPFNGDQFDVNSIGPFGLRLFVGNPDDTSTAIRYLTEQEFRGTSGLRRANAWTKDFFQNAGGNVATDMALSDDNSSAIGIADPGSDDVVFTF